MPYYIGSILILSGLIGYMSAKDPETVQGISMAGFWAGLLMIGLYHIKTRKPGEKWLAQVILIGLYVRFAMALVHLAVGFWFYQGEVDFPGYHSTAVEVGQNLLRGHLTGTGGRDLGTQAAEHLLGLFYLLSGPGIVGMFLLSGLIGFLGSYLFLRAFETEFPSVEGRDRRFLAWTLFLLPSLAYWAILLGKDSWIFFFLGWTSYAFVNLLHRFRFRHLLGLVVSLAGIALIRLPVGAVLTLAIGCAWVFKRGPGGPAAILAPVRLAAIALVISWATLKLAGSYLGGYDLLETNLLGGVVEIGMSKHVGLSTDPTAGGSSLPIAIAQPSFGGVLRYLPFGMFTFLFRPLVFEAHHALAVAAALESSFFLILAIWRRRNLFAALRAIFTNPFIVFCGGTFLLLTAILSLETNFGVIVRHRTMVLPFLLILMAMPYEPRRRRTQPVPV